MKQIKKVSRTSLETSGYELPIASNTTLGGIKVGANLSIDADGTLNANSGSGTGLSNIYSEEETVVGTWIDGKPLYRKVVKYTLETPKFYPSYPNFDTGIRNIDYIMIDVQVSNGDNNLQYFRTKKAFHGYLEKATGYYHFVFAKSGDPLNAEAGLYVFVFHYTKTTD